MPRARNGERRAERDRERRAQRALAAAGLRRSHRITPQRAARATRTARGWSS